MFMKRAGWLKPIAGISAIVIVAAACSSSGSSPSAAAKSFKIGYSNGGGVGNGFREEQVCTAKAQALVSGAVSDLTVIHRNTDAAGQLSDIRDLISKGVNAIVFNPNDKAALNPALAEAKAAGIKTVSVDAYVTDPNTYNLYNNQVKYAELGAKWLFDQMGGTGTVYYMRGLAGHPADSDRDIGFKNVLKSYPNIKVVPNADGVATGWDPATATKLINDFIASGQYDTIQGIWQAVRADRRRRPRRVRQAAPRPGRLSGPQGRCGHQHGRRRRRGRGPRAQAPQRRDGHHRSVGQPAEHGPPGPEGGRQPDRRQQGDLEVVAVRAGPRPDLAARHPDRRLDHLHPGPGDRLQGPRRPVTSPSVNQARGMPFTGIPRTTPPQGRP